MKKIILSLMFLSFLIPGVGNIQADLRAKALDNAAGFYSDYLDDEGFVKYDHDGYDGFLSYNDFTLLNSLINVNSVKNDDYLIDSLINSGRIKDYIEPGEEFDYPLSEDDRYNIEQNESLNLNLIYNPNHDTIKVDHDGNQYASIHSYFTLYTVVADTSMIFRESASYISFMIDSGLNFRFERPYGFEIPSILEQGGYAYIIDYLNYILNVGEECPLFRVNNQTIAKFVKHEDGIKLYSDSKSKVYFSNGGYHNYSSYEKDNLFIDLFNVGQIDSIEYLIGHNYNQSSSVYLEDIYFSNNTYEEIYIDSPFFIVDYDHFKKYLTLKTNVFSITYSGYDSLESITIDGIKLDSDDIELIDDYSINDFNYIRTYKLNLNNSNLTTHDIIINNMIVYNSSSDLKTVNDYTVSFRYLNQDVHHRLRVDANIDYWFNYSKVWFTITDLEAQCRILNNMADITFAYYELDKEWTKPNAEELIRVVYHNRFENLQIYFEAFVKEIFNKTYDELTYAEKYHLVSSITSNEEFIDKYGRTWNLKYVKGDAGNRIEQEWSGVTGGHHDWELYTSKPGNLVYWDPELLIIYVSYITEAGETIKTSAYKDGLYAEQIDGEWVIKDYQGNIYDNYSVNEDGLIFDENGDMVKSDTTDVNYDPFDSVVKWFEEAFSSKNILKLIGITFGILAVVGLGYILFIYTKHKVIANASKKKKRK